MTTHVYSNPTRAAGSDKGGTINPVAPLGTCHARRPRKLPSNQRQTPLYCLAIEELAQKTGLCQWEIAEFALALLIDQHQAREGRALTGAEPYSELVLLKARQMLSAVGDATTWSLDGGRWRCILDRLTDDHGRASKTPSDGRRTDGLLDGRRQRATGRTVQKNLRQTWTYICLIKAMAARTGEAESALAEEALRLVQASYAGALDCRIPPREARHGR